MIIRGNYTTVEEFADLPGVWDIPDQTGTPVRHRLGRDAPFDVGPRRDWTGKQGCQNGYGDAGVGDHRGWFGGERK